MPDQSASLLVGPPAIKLSRTAPFWWRSELPLAPVGVVLVNTGSDPVSISRADCDPLQDNETGAAAPTLLAAAISPSADRLLGPGESAQLTLTGRVPARAGVYSSTVRIRTASGAVTTIPLTVNVSASPLRGIACTLLGLVLAALISVLQTESNRYEQLANLNQLALDNEEWLQRNPVPSIQAPNLDAYEADMQAAKRLLLRPRPPSMIDWRLPMAEQRQHTAENELKSIKDAMAHEPPGAAEIAELDSAWKDLQQKLDALSVRDESWPGAAATNLGPKLEAFLRTLKTSFLLAPIQDASREISTHVTLADLTSAAGQREAARQQAIEVQGWLQREAHELNQPLITLATFEQLARSISVEDALTRQRLADPAVPSDARQSITAAMDTASTNFSANAPVASFAESYRRALRAGTDLLRVRRDILLQQVQQAVAQAAAETDKTPVDQVMAQDPPNPHDPAERRVAFLHRIIAAWRPLVASVADQSTRTALDKQLDSVDHLLDQGDLKATSAPYKAYMQAWTDYGLQRIEVAVKALTTPFCRDLGIDRRRLLADTEARMKFAPQSTDLPRWEATLNRIRVQSSLTPEDDCLSSGTHRKDGTFDVVQAKSSAQLDLFGETVTLANEVFTAVLEATPLPPVTRLEAAQNSGVAQAVDLERRLLTGPRVLTITARPDEAGRTAKRPIRFDVSNLDATWGAGVLVAIDYGDHTPVDQRSAEQLRKEPFTHTYDISLKPRVTVKAATSFQPNSVEPKDEPLGVGTLAIEIRESPIWVMRSIADGFVNVRFAMAAAIAFLVYFWQFQSKQPNFGSTGFDYVKAFALGFVVEAAVSNLPEFFQKIALG